MEQIIDIGRSNSNLKNDVYECQVCNTTFSVEEDTEVNFCLRCGAPRLKDDSTNSKPTI